MEYPKVKKNYPCGRQCIYIVKNRPWVSCNCTRTTSKLDKLVIISK